MKHILNDVYEMRSYLALWLTQMISGLGSAMTSYALVIWSYTQQGSALATAMLMVCSYTPYVVCSVFAGALSDRWDKKKIMLTCDALAAVCTMAVLLLLKTGSLRVWHLYVVNAISGLMNTVQRRGVSVCRALADGDPGLSAVPGGQTYLEAGRIRKKPRRRKNGKKRCRDDFSGYPLQDPGGIPDAGAKAGRTGSRRGPTSAGD